MRCGTTSACFAMRPACSAACRSSRPSRASCSASACRTAIGRSTSPGTTGSTCAAWWRSPSVITLAALKRENSRGAHYREDFPGEGDLATSTFTVARQRDGQPRHRRRAGAVHHRQARREPAQGGRGIGSIMTTELLFSLVAGGMLYVLVPGPRDFRRAQLLRDAGARRVRKIPGRASPVATLSGRSWRSWPSLAHRGSAQGYSMRSAWCVVFT